jgi:putative transposase
MSRPKRLGNVCYVGVARYFLTFCVHERRKVFTCDQSVQLALLHIRQSARHERFSLFAYCFMPDHVHLLVESMSIGSDLRRFVARAKQHSGAAFALKHGGRLWQAGYYERILRRSEDAKWVARYIVNNPVRAGLVSSPSQYAYFGSDVWTLDELMGSI